jgi:gliding motility-associated-like protein
MTNLSLKIKLLHIRISIVLLVFLIGSIELRAQVSSTKGRFEVNTIKGCAPLTVSATNTSGLDPAQFPIVWNMNWDGDESTIEVDPSQSASLADTTYNIPGTYKILQVIGNQADPIDTIIIEVMEPLEPEFQVYNCISNSIFVDFSNESYYDQLQIDFGDGNIELVDVDQTSLTHAYAQGGDYIISIEGVFVGATQNCAVVDTTITTLQNLDISEIDLIRVEGDQEIQLAYDLEDPNVYYRLEVAENNSTDFTFASIDLNSGSSAYNWQDPRLDTRNNYYCFRIVAVNRCDESRNLPSNIVCSISLQATPEDLQNQLDWQSEGYSSFFINRDGSRLLTVSQTAYTDTEVVCQEDYFYTVTGQSGNAISISNRVNVTAIATAIPPAPIGMAARLRAQGAQLRWPSVPEAEIFLIYRSEGGGPAELYDSLQVTPSQQFSYTEPRELTVDVRYCYQLAYRDECGNESILGEESCVLLPKQARIYFPTAFTPNGDGLNDIFVYKASLLAEVSFQIYNRWGEVVFSTEEIGTGWDGNYLGQAAPEGTYLFKLEVRDELGNQFDRTGRFTLLHAAP